MADAGDVWVYAERKGEGFQPVSLEILGKAREIADRMDRDLVALTVGDESRAPADLLRYDVDSVTAIEDPRVTRYDSLLFTKLIEEEVRASSPSILLVGATRNGQDLAGRLAVRLRTGLTAHCTALDVADDGLLVGWVPGFGGGIEAAIKCPSRRPQMATVRPGVFSVPAPAEPHGKLRGVRPRISEQDFGSRLVSVTERGGTVDLTRSSVIVVGGRGTGGDFSALERLARALGGEVGATRVAADEGWVDRERMIGQTGVSTRPKLALVLGASGAVQFTVGIENAECVIAVNRDPEAPIFSCADLGIVGDLKPVVSSLLKRLGGG